MKSLAIVFGSIAMLTCAIAPAQADDVASEVPKARLANMGLAGLRPMSDATGNQVHGNRAIFGGTGAIGIPLDVVSSARLVVRLNWSYHEGFPAPGAAIWNHLLEVGKDPEPIPPGPVEF